MCRSFVVACALGLWAGSAVAQQMQLPSPTLSARQQRCTARQRSACAAVDSAMQPDALECDACGAPASSVPAEIVAPSARDTPQKARPQPGTKCVPVRGADEGCLTLPPLDAVPRP